MPDYFLNNFKNKNAEKNEENFKIAAESADEINLQNSETYTYYDSASETLNFLWSAGKNISLWGWE